MNYNWRESLAEALRRNRRDADHRYFQLATLAEDGWPANRTVVFRGFSEDGQRLQVATDARSEKHTQLATNPQVEVCWYFVRSREQFRIRGRAALHDAGAVEAPARERLWNAMSDAARAQFFWRDPGAALGEGADIPVTQSPPASFLLLEVEPLQIDHLQLASQPQQRHRSWIERGAWQSFPMNP